MIRMFQTRLKSQNGVKWKQCHLSKSFMSLSREVKCCKGVTIHNVTAVVANTPYFPLTAFMKECC